MEFSVEQFGSYLPIARFHVLIPDYKENGMLPSTQVQVCHLKFRELFFYTHTVATSTPECLSPAGF